MASEAEASSLRIRAAAALASPPALANSAAKRSKAGAVMKFLGKHLVRSFNIEPTNRCVLACAECARTGNDFIRRNPADIPLAVLRNAFPLDRRADFAGLKVNLCGAVGDAIYHKDLHGVLSYLKQAGLRVELETNGSFRSPEWWEKTHAILTEEDQITFSVDGLADTNHIYRKNARWSDIEWAMRYSAARLRVSWKFIVFRHNEHQLDAVRALAAEIGVRSIIFKKSSRFRDEDALAPADDRFIGVATRNRRAVRALGEEAAPQVVIKPKCISGKNLAITATGYLFPCTSCEIQAQDDWFNANRAHFDLKSRTVFEILASEQWAQLERAWDRYDTAPAACRSYCGAHRDFVAAIDRAARPDRVNRPEDSEIVELPAA
jgi:MoaA/NifB/PqqE/SkfB family radical SAM enzyme